MKCDARKESQKVRFAPPRLEDVAAYVKAKGYTSFTPEQFFYYYETNGWVVARGRPMKDWRSAVNYWAARNRAKQTAAPHNTNNTNRNYGNHDNHTGPDDLAGGAANDRDREKQEYRARMCQWVKRQHEAARADIARRGDC